MKEFKRWRNNGSSETFSFLTPTPSPMHIYLLGHSSPSPSCPMPVDERLSQWSDHPDQPRRVPPSSPSPPSLPPRRWWRALKKVQVLGHLPHRAHPTWGATALRDLHPAGPKTILHRLAMATSLSCSTCETGGSQPSTYWEASQTCAIFCPEGALWDTCRSPLVAQAVVRLSRRTRPGITSASSTGETHRWRKTTSRDEGVATAPNFFPSPVPLRCPPPLPASGSLSSALAGTPPAAALRPPPLPRQNS